MRAHIGSPQGYSMSEWHDDVKRVLLSCGLDDKPSVLLIVDTQIVHEAMLEDVSNLLNSGDVPGLYTPEELDQIMEASKFACQLKGLPLTKLNLYNQCVCTGFHCRAARAVGVRLATDARRRTLTHPCGPCDVCAGTSLACGATCTLSLR